MTVTAAKNTSTSARSGSITVKSGSLSKMVTISQEGANVTGADIVLTFTGTTPSGISVGQVFYLSMDSGSTVEFYQPMGTIKGITTGAITIDISSLSKSDVDRIYNDLYNGDMIEMNEIFFGVSAEDDPEADWNAILKTTEVGSYTYTSQYVAEVLLAAYNGQEQDVKCTLINGGSTSSDTYLIMDDNFCNIFIDTGLFDEVGASSLQFYVQAKLTNGVTIDSGSILELTPSKNSGALYVLFDETTIPANVSIEGFYIKCTARNDANPFPVLDGESSAASMTFTNNQVSGTTWIANFSDGTTYDLGFRFNGNKITFVGSYVQNHILSTTNPTVTITAIG